MLEFERVVEVPDSDSRVYVFVDVEKGHTVYMSHNGALNVVEEEKKAKSKDRVAGFLASNNCSDCTGC